MVRNEVEENSGFLLLFRCLCSLQTGRIYTVCMLWRSQLPRLPVSNLRALYDAKIRSSFTLYLPLLFYVSATAYGDGVYFATFASLSIDTKYSRPDSEDRSYIYWCRVLTGIYTIGANGLKEPPERKSKLKKSSVRYDSVADKLDKPEIFVIFHDTQAYPEYLITFERHAKKTSSGSKLGTW